MFEYFIYPAILILTKYIGICCLKDVPAFSKKKKKNQHILTHKQILLFDTISKIPRQHCDTTMKALYIQWGYSKTNTCISQRKSMIAG